MPEEEEEEEQEEDESVPDLTGFVLDDMKQYVHLHTLWSLDTSESDRNIFIIVLQCKKDLMTPDVFENLCDLGDTTALSPNYILESSAIPAECVLPHLRQMCTQII